MMTNFQQFINHCVTDNHVVHQWSMALIDMLLHMDNDDDDEEGNWIDDTRRLLKKAALKIDDDVAAVTEHASKVKNHTLHVDKNMTSLVTGTNYNNTSVTDTDTDDNDVGVSVGVHFRNFLQKWYPYDTKYLPITLLSIAFFIILLVSAAEAFKCHYYLSKHPRAHSSHGDRTRSVFYDWFTLAIFIRLICMSWEAVIEFKGEEYLVCLHTPGCILARSLPDLVFASAYTVLVLFYAYLAGKASSSGPRGISLLLNQHFNWFTAGNIVVYLSYTILLVLAYFEIIPLMTFQLFTYALLFGLYGINLLILAYFGPLLYTLLSPVLLKVAGRGLSTKLIGMCFVCLCVFLSRLICFGLALWYKEARYTHGLVPYYLIPVPHSEAADGQFDHLNQEDDNVLRRDLLGYTILELLPAIAILSMMHQGIHPKYQVESATSSSSSSSNNPSRHESDTDIITVGETQALLTSTSAVGTTNYGNTSSTNAIVT